MAPLKSSSIIPEDRRTEFLGQVFWNLHDIIAVNTRLRDALNKRQKSYAIIERIGDIFLDVVPHFSPFVSYGAHQLCGKYEFEKEKTLNPEFQKFVDVGGVLFSNLQIGALLSAIPRLLSVYLNLANLSLMDT